MSLKVDILKVVNAVLMRNMSLNNTNYNIKTIADTYNVIQLQCVPLLFYLRPLKRLAQQRHKYKANNLTYQFVKETRKLLTN